jgi:hypothetical protein
MWDSEVLPLSELLTSLIREVREYLRLIDIPVFPKQLHKLAMTFVFR